MEKVTVKEVKLRDGRLVDVELQSMSFRQENNCTRHAMKKMTAASAVNAGDVEVDPVAYMEWMLIETIVAPVDLKSLAGLDLLEPADGRRLRDEASKLNFVNPLESTQSATP
jgi:hypothetical protein